MSGGNDGAYPDGSLTLDGSRLYGMTAYGGATGIGFSLAEHFVKAGNDVIVCGRRQEKLREAKSRLPQIHTRECDVSKDKERGMLSDWVVSNFKDINILVNNAGVQRMIDFRKGAHELFGGEDEIETNLKAYIHMSAYFIPDFLKRKESAIINVSSGLAFVPLAVGPCLLRNQGRGAFIQCLPEASVERHSHKGL
jgi:uncharacterized oxidoreductase